MVNAGMEMLVWNQLALLHVSHTVACFDIVQAIWLKSDTIGDNGSETSQFVLISMKKLSFHLHFTAGVVKITILNSNTMNYLASCFMLM